MTTVLDRLEDLERKATKGPWLARLISWTEESEKIGFRILPSNMIEDPGDSTDGKLTPICGDNNYEHWNNSRYSEDERKANAALIALSRNHLAALIAIAKAGAKLSVYAQTTGGTAGRDDGLMRVVDEFSAALALLDKPA